MQCLTYATVVLGDAAEVAVLVYHLVTIAPLVIAEVTLVVAVQISQVVGERVCIREIVHVKERERWQQSLAVLPRRSHYYRDRELAVRVPEHLLRQVLPAIGVLERQIELICVQSGAVPVEMTGTDGPVAVQASSEDVQVAPERRLERFHVRPPSITTAAIAAHYSDQFALGGSQDSVPIFGRKVPGSLYRPSVGNRHIAVHSVGHGPVEQTVVVRQSLTRIVQKRMEG